MVASPTFRQSISQNLADTVVVKETQSLTKVSGVDPVTSSHCARDVPPAEETSTRPSEKGAFPGPAAGPSGPGHC